ncbi:DUF1742-domain-containing protein [Auricularia subglabra TFB-10046 SS5]|nr:DUF1742-domain-containing protein [Auricularia subglabra TFB-10046 SS5]
MATFKNVYYKRAVATAKPCFVCFKPTTTVLATMDATDFIYSCDLHLSDAGFASRITDEPAKKSPSVSTDEILKIKQEWDERQKRKEEKEKEQKDDKDKANDKDKKDDDDTKKNTKSPAPSLPASPPATAKPTHEKYSLHRDIFAMRQSEHRKRRNAAQAKEVAPRIPSAPRSSID